MKQETKTRLLWGFIILMTMASMNILTILVMLKIMSAN